MIKNWGYILIYGKGMGIYMSCLISLPIYWVSKYHTKNKIMTSLPRVHIFRSYCHPPGPNIDPKGHHWIHSCSFSKSVKAKGNLFFDVPLYFQFGYRFK